MKKTYTGPDKKEPGLQISSLIVFIWPFIYCYKYVISGSSFSLTMGNDFPVLYNYKLILLDKLSNLSLPLWSPSEACGYPFFSNPFVQEFYPLNLILAAAYKINGGYSYADHQIFTVLGLSIFAVGLLLWLHSLKINPVFVLTAVMLISVSSRLTEILRFTNAIHTIAWVPFILYGMTLAADSAKKIKSGMIIFVSVIMMVTAGYVYYVYYSVFLFIPYAAVLVYSVHKKFIFSERKFSLKAYSAVIIASVTAAALVCYPYLNSVKLLMDQTDLRVGSSFEFSTLHKFTFKNTLGSLFYPSASHIDGWYYFGLAAIMIVAVMYLYVIINRSRFRNQFLLLAVILVWYIIISYITYGESSYLFRILWDYFPGFSRLRIWGRMNIIFVPVFAFLLSLAFETIYGLIREGKENKADSKYKYLLISIAVLFAVILSVQIYFYYNKVFFKDSISYAKDFSGEFDEKVFILYNAISFFLIFSFLAGRKFLKNKRILYFFLFLIFTVNILDLYASGGRQWALSKMPDSKRKIIRTDELIFNSLNVPREYRSGMISLSPNFSVGFVDEWYFDRYHTFLKKYEEDLNNDPEGKLTEAFNYLLGINDGRRIFCSSEVKSESIIDFVSDANKSDSLTVISIKTEKYNGDEMVCIIETREDTYCSFIDNWDSNWEAYVNGNKVNIEKLFGTFKSVKIGKGRNTVVFRYNPPLFGSF